MKPDNLFRMLNHWMDYIDQQVKLSMENMANLHSPGYHAKELRPLDFKKVLRSDPGFTITHPAHIRDEGLRKCPVHTENGAQTYQGNNMNLRTESMKANRAGSDKLQMVNLMRALTGMIETALKIKE